MLWWLLSLFFVMFMLESVNRLRSLLVLVGSDVSVVLLGV